MRSVEAKGHSIECWLGSFGTRGSNMTTSSPGFGVRRRTVTLRTIELEPGCPNRPLITSMAAGRRRGPYRLVQAGSASTSSRGYSGV
jgi:hypothetical protein